MKTIRKRASVLSKKIDSRYFILDGGNEYLRELNETASYIWKILDKPQTIDSLTVAVAKAFEVKPQIAQKDITKLINDLDQINLITYNSD